MSLREFHGLFLHANKRMDTHSDLNRSLSNRNKSQLEAKVLTQSQIQSNRHRHNRRRFRSNQLAGHPPKRTSWSNEKHQNRMLHN